MIKPLVKICGITNLDDALASIYAGADALGFVFAESPRRVSPAEIKDILHRLPVNTITSVGLFVDMPLANVIACVQKTGIQAVQLHGDEQPEYVDELKRELDIQDEFSGWPKLIKAFRLRCAGCLGQLRAYTAAQAFLVDAYVEGKAGGTGQKADWSLAAQAKQFGKPLILAGGLTPENVPDAIAQVQPFGFDVSSGVESVPGKKDPQKIKQFIQRLKTID